MIAGAAVVAGARGLSKGKEALDRNTESKGLIEQVESLYNSGRNKLEIQKAITSRDLDLIGQTKLNIWGREMNQFLTTFKSFKNIIFFRE